MHGADLVAGTAALASLVQRRAPGGDHRVERPLPDGVLVTARAACIHNSVARDSSISSGSVNATTPTTRRATRGAR
jgi:hypothetical protein